jgi:uncharacterized protein (TIGR02996 family)
MPSTRAVGRPPKYVYEVGAAGATDGPLLAPGRIGYDAAIMNDRTALLDAIIRNPDEDAPRLIYADWLDEHAPDRTPSPAAGPSARAEYIRIQCQLARFPFDDPDYPEWLERQDDLADWLNSHTPDEQKRPAIPDTFDWWGEFDGGEYRSFDRGFPSEIEFSEYDDEPETNVATITADLPKVFARTTVRGLCLEEDAYGSEVAGVLADPCAAGLRGLALCDLADDGDGEAVRAVATSPHLTALRRLRLEVEPEAPEVKLLARAPHLGALEAFTFRCRSPGDLAVLGAAHWFRGLRHLRVWLDDRDAFKALADLPPMPHLVALTVEGATAPTAVAVRRFAASGSFPRLGRLEIDNPYFAPALVALLAAGEWPLRHLQLVNVPVQKVGAEALAGSPFAGALRVLDLRGCGITAGGVQALAGAEALAGLRHLDLTDNPIGTGGLIALARSRHLRRLRRLCLNRCNSSRAPLDAAGVLGFLSGLELPDLRHLELDHLPVCVRGARALAAGATFARLTRLSLTECGLREPGARAVVESPVFTDLAVLELASNAAGKGAARLANPTTFPRLGRANLLHNRIPKGPLARLRKRPGVAV